MKLPESREDFEEFYILCEDVDSYRMAFQEFDFDDTMEIMLRLNNNRNIEFRMELCSASPYIIDGRCMFMFAVGVLVEDGVADGYVNIHYSEIIKKEYPIDLSQIKKKMYGEYEFYSADDLLDKGIELISQHFDIRLIPAAEE